MVKREGTEKKCGMGTEKGFPVQGTVCVKAWRMEQWRWDAKKILELEYRGQAAAGPSQPVMTEDIMLWVYTVLGRLGSYGSGQSKGEACSTSL